MDIGKGKIRVLVYGTLKQGQANHPLLDHSGADFLGYDAVKANLTMWDLGAMPAAVASEDETLIRGELYAVDDDTLAALDMLEGQPFLFQRRKHWLHIRTTKAWVYELISLDLMEGNDDAEECKAGIWTGTAEERRFWITARKEEAKQK